MKKGMIALLILLCLICMVSCGKDKELTARVDALEGEVQTIKNELTAKVDTLESEVQEIKAGPIANYYGQVYRVTEQTWEKFEEFYNSIDLENYFDYSSDKRDVEEYYNNGKDMFLRKVLNSVAINTDGSAVSISDSSYAHLYPSYDVVGNILVGTTAPDKYGDTYDEKIGIFSEDQSSLCIWIGIDDSIPLYLYK